MVAKGISTLEEAWMQSSTLTNTQVEDLKKTSFVKLFVKVNAIFSQSLLDTRLRVLLIDCILGKSLRYIQMVI